MSPDERIALMKLIYWTQVEVNRMGAIRSALLAPALDNAIKAFGITDEDMEQARREYGVQ